MHVRSRFAGAKLPLLLIPLLASPALCEERPVITKILDFANRETRVVSPSYPFTVKGSGLYRVPEDPKAKGFPGLKATLDGKPLQVTAASPTSLSFNVPATQPEGKRKTLVIVVNGKRVRATVDVGPARQQGPDGETEEVSPLDVTRFEAISTSAGLSFVVEGRATGFVDRVKLGLQLRYGRHEVQRRTIRVQKESFALTFGPFRKKVPVGVYAVDVEFSFNRQPKSVSRDLERTSKAKGKPITRSTHPVIRRRELTTVGATGPEGQILPKDRETQDAALRERVEASHAAITKLLNEVLAARALADRVYFRAPGESRIDEKRYLQWLQDEGHAKDEATARKLLDDDRFASRRAELDETAWETFVRERIHAGAKAELEAAKAFDAPYLCPIDPELQRTTQLALEQLLEVARALPLFKRAKRPFPKSLNSTDFGISPRGGSTPATLRKTLARLKLLARTR